VRERTRDVIFNLEQMGNGEEGKRRVVRRRKSICGVTPRMLGLVVNVVLFVLWFLATGPVLKRIGVVCWGRVRGR
jgi:hypothetical protein